MPFGRLFTALSPGVTVIFRFSAVMFAPVISIPKLSSAPFSIVIDKSSVPVIFKVAPFETPIPELVYASVPPTTSTSPAVL